MVGTADAFGEDGKRTIPDHERTCVLMRILCKLVRNAGAIERVSFKNKTKMPKRRHSGVLHFFRICLRAVSNISCGKFGIGFCRREGWREVFCGDRGESCADSAWGV